MELKKIIAGATRTGPKALNGINKSRSEFGVTMKMCLVSSHECTEPEDIAYCLFGIFDVSMEVIYREGAEKAFLRLQEKIMTTTNDQSLLAWDPRPEQSDGESGTYATATPIPGLVGLSLATHDFFRNSGDIHFCNPLLLHDTPQLATQWR
jgi:hypothetical protein